ncbi:MAG: hypothetical protein Q6373_014470 [Candidatus Sigynarchaeota archaeon]
MIEQSFEFKATVEAAVSKMEKFISAFPAELGKQLSKERELGKVACKESGPRENNALQLAITAESGDEKVEGSIDVSFTAHATALLARGTFTWHATREVAQGSRLVAAMEKGSFVKAFQKRVAAAMQGVLAATAGVPAGGSGGKPGAGSPGQQQAPKPISCPRCGYTIQPGSVKHGRCPFCQVKL